MNEVIIAIISILIGGGIGTYLGITISKLKSKGDISTLEERQNLLQQNILDLKETIQRIEEDRESIRAEKDHLNSELTRKQTEFENLQQKNQEQKQEVEKLQEKFTKEFENLANKILDEKSSKFTKQNKEHLEVLLNPLQEKIKGFEKRVEDTNKESIGRHSELKEQIKTLAELNQQMSKDADNLTKALKGDSKMQGNWGELILTRILEKSGLEKDREYTVQDSHSTEDGKRLQTDVLIHLPDGKKMIIDSKVSLVHFERFVSEEDEEQKQVYLKQHIASIKRHVEQLSAKNYQYLIEESPDTVFMFIPIEPAFAIASAHEPNLYEQAFDRQVIIVTPATLLAALRLVDNLWQNDRQRQNALEIATEAGNLYDSFTNLTDELIKVGKQIGTVQTSYEGAMKKLTGRGNLIGRVEKLKKLGAKASKNLNENLLKRAEEDDE
ncbi:DNA recombination protein RmuC [Mangrovimonas sp. AS39]|uniref:DNA recombination protein RmuC n=1 Tax=Mangrovimonas futianensis TaxID=2895523 RepID=UPI001E3CE050|nr:DNA recombination protein RmuC [Mangrovimonas futianensis]MCF1191937.1 DNA recombination protein RmuC [Mangrovimonas futianensis]MCF1195631.1 DNA recombination protein RmuC [Mangrovimonas futianensis]